MARRTIQSNTITPRHRARFRGSSETVISTVRGPSVNLSYPLSNIGGVVPFVVGQKLITQPNIIYVSAARPLTERTTVTTVTIEEDADGNKFEVSTEVTTTSIVGYHIDIMFGVCLGPEVRLISIKAGGKEIWVGNIGPARTAITLEAPDTAYDGIEMHFAGGAFNQAAEPLVTTADFPGHVGVAYAFFKNVRADLDLSPLSFEVIRKPNPFALVDAVNFKVNDMNLATMMAEVCTNVWGGAGLDFAALDIDSFVNGAATLAAEDNFGSLMVTEVTGARNVIELIQDQAFSVLIQNPTNGLVELKLPRTTSYDLETVAKFGKNNVTKINDFNKSGWPTTVEQLVGYYTDRKNNYASSPVFMQNLSNYTGEGRGKRSDEIQWPLVHDAALAIELTARELAATNIPTFTISFNSNREGSDVLPGDVVSIFWPDYELVSALVLVTKVRKPSILSSDVIISGQQFRVPVDRVEAPEPPEPYEPEIDFDAVAPTSSYIITAPYWFARARHGIDTSLLSPFVYPAFLLEPANNLQFSFGAYQDNVSADGPVERVSAGSYPTFGTLVAPIDIYDAFDDGVIASVQIEGVVNPVNLYQIDEAGVRSGRTFVIVGTEIMSFEDCNDLGGDTWELLNVHRGLLDTVAADHAAADAVYIVTNNFNFVSGNGFTLPVATPDWLFTSNTLLYDGDLNDALSSNDWSETLNRTAAPLRPVNIQINAVRSIDAFASNGEDITVSWATRSRARTVIDLQADAAVAGEVTAGVYQTHEILLLDSAATLTILDETADTADDNSMLVTIPVDAALGPGFIGVRAKYRGKTSYQFEWVPLEILSATSELRITEDSQTRRTEDGETRVTE